MMYDVFASFLTLAFSALPGKSGKDVSKMVKHLQMNTQKPI